MLPYLMNRFEEGRTANFLTGDAARRYMTHQAEQFRSIYGDLGLGRP